MAEFKLSSVLQGHANDVKAGVFAGQNIVFTASRDGFVKRWNLNDTTNGRNEDPTDIYQASSYVNSLAFIPPSDAFPEGLIASAGSEGIIDVRAPSKTTVDDPDAVLVGHSSNVCALTVSSTGSHLISGSWDLTARIWKVGVWGEPTAILDEHQGGVWAIATCFLDGEEVILTGSADKVIRIYSLEGKLLNSDRFTADIVRSICPLPKGNVYKADFVSAGNDQVIQLWSLSSTKPIFTLVGHTNFIYFIGVLSTGQLVSCSEDRTLKIWNGHEVIQSITLPAISVWAAIVSDRDDIMTCTSDNLARFFSRDPSRLAPPDVQEQFKSALENFAIPKQTMDGANQPRGGSHPGPDFLKTNQGKRAGQTQLISEPDGSVTAYSWSANPPKWELIGTVVDGAGSSSKKVQYRGMEYDFVFDVDIEDGKPPLKLPYNLRENPFTAAGRFLDDNELPKTYYEKVAEFIMTNTKGFTFDSKPESETVSTQQPDDLLLPTIPAKSYTTLADAKVEQIKKKLVTVNESLSDSAKLSAHEVSTVEELLGAVDKCVASKSSNGCCKLPSEGQNTLLKMAATWEEPNRFAVFDALRLVAAFAPEVVGKVDLGSIGEYPSLVSFLIRSDSPGCAFQTGSSKGTILMGLRTLTNTFSSPAGEKQMLDQFDTVLSTIEPYIVKPSVVINSSTPARELNTIRNRDASLAIILQNYAVQLSKEEDAPDTAAKAVALIQLTKQLVDRLFNSTATDPEKSRPNSNADIAIIQAVSALGTQLLTATPSSLAILKKADHNLETELEALMQLAARDGCFSRTGSLLWTIKKNI